MKLGDVFYYRGTPCTVCALIEEDVEGIPTTLVTVKWFKDTVLKTLTVKPQELSPIPKHPEYFNYLNYTEEVGLLETVGSSDDLEEFLLNEAVSTLAESLREYNIDHTKLVYAVYDIIRNRSSAFKYLSDCYFVEGYQQAIEEVYFRNKCLGTEVMKDVLKSTHEYQGK